jgi:hypothetical protein
VSHSQAGPPKIDSQLLGAVPSGLGSAQTYQSALGLSRLDRLCLNHGMLVGGVRNHLIDDDLEPFRMGQFDQFVEIRKRAEHRIDIAVIRHVITEIGHRRLEERRQPDGIDAE